ncbi:hypothetical protein [Saliterribacillus persicus]|uniref:Uncharacterized protein n=1 Tax=Saliterribacillus persicus TaxID=930114 RepID=A0A368X8V5_9BACI|nr:hypothetical protein [Saliterribacillus persicus]RCW62867.1 hypothetical protein DFR57_12236 [Saliterribacillus persicus]
MGGLIFTWQDEWFKRTWNTMDYDNPDRRPFWSNAQTNEQQFGLLSFDRHKIKVDGDPSEWEKPSLYEKETGPLKAMFVDHDERYLYLREDLDEKKEGSPVLLLDILPEQGNLSIEGKDNISFENGIDFLIDLNEEESRMKVDAYYDFYTYQYGHQLELLEPKPPVPTKNSGEFNPIRLALNKAYYIPDQDKTIPFSFYVTGKLKKGDGNPTSKEYDSLVDYSVSDSGVLELRIPWLLIQAKDPSQKEFIGNIYEDGITASKVIEELNIGVLYENSSGEIIDSFPEVAQNALGKLKAYTWENWNLPESEERLKQSYEIIQDLYYSY